MGTCLAATNPTFTPSDWDPFKVKTQHEEIKSALNPVVAWLNSNTPLGDLADDTLKAVSDLLVSSLDDLLKDPAFNANVPVPEHTGTDSPLEAIPGALRSLTNPTVIEGIKAALHGRLPDLLKQYAKLYKASLQLYKADKPLEWIRSRQDTIRAVHTAVGHFEAGAQEESRKEIASGALSITAGGLGLASLIVAPLAIAAGVAAAPFTAGASLALVVLSVGASCASAAVALNADTVAESTVNDEMEALRKCLRKDAGISPEMEVLLTLIAQAWEGVDFSVKDTTSDLFKRYAQVPPEKWVESGKDALTNHDVMNAWAVAHSIVITNFLAHLTDAHTPMEEGKKWISWVVKGGSAAYSGVSIPLEVWRAGRVVLDASRLVTARLSTVAATAMGDVAQLSKVTTAAEEIFAKAALKIAAGEGTIPIIGRTLYKAGGKAAVALAVIGDIYAIGSGIQEIIYGIDGQNKLREAADRMRTFSDKLIEEYKASCSTLAGFAHLRDPHNTVKSVLKQGEVLLSLHDGKQDEYLLSPGGWFRLCCQSDGNLCMYRGENPLPEDCMWASMTMTDPAEGPFRLEFAPNGGVRWVTANGRQLWPPNNGDLMEDAGFKVGPDECTELQLGDDGNLRLVILPKGDIPVKQPEVVWKKDVVVRASSVGDPGSTIKSVLKQGEVLLSAHDGKEDGFLMAPGGWFRLCCRSDGNLIMVVGDYDAVWATMSTANPAEGPFRLEFAPTGGVRWVTAKGRQLWPLNDRDLLMDFGYKLGADECTELQLGDDGNLRLAVLPKGQNPEDKSPVVVWKLNVLDMPLSVVRDNPDWAVKSVLKQGEVLHSPHPMSGKRNDFLLSKNGRYKLSCQWDGNLCLYVARKPGSECLWASDTQCLFMGGPDLGPFRLEFSPTGGVRWLMKNGTQLWPPNNRDLMVDSGHKLGPGERTELQLGDDGSLRLVVLPRQPVVWELLVADKPFEGGCVKWGTSQLKAPKPNVGLLLESYFDPLYVFLHGPGGDPDDN